MKKTGSRSGLIESVSETLDCIKIFILWEVIMEVAYAYQSVGSAHVSEHPARMHRHDQNSCIKDRPLPNLNRKTAKRMRAKCVKNFARGIADKGRISMGHFKITSE
jgi:hypothetical protein